MTWYSQCKSLRAVLALRLVQLVVRGSTVDQGVNSGLDVTVLVLAYGLRDSGIVEVFPEIGGRNIEFVNYDDKQSWPYFWTLRNLRRDHTPLCEALIAKLNSLFAPGE